MVKINLMAVFRIEILLYRNGTHNFEKSYPQIGPHRCLCFLTGRLALHKAPGLHVWLWGLVASTVPLSSLWLDPDFTTIRRPCEHEK
jgi:hypothetical protein